MTQFIAESRFQRPDRNKSGRFVQHQSEFSDEIIGLSRLPCQSPCGGFVRPWRGSGSMACFSSQISVLNEA